MGEECEPWTKQLSNEVKGQPTASSRRDSSVWTANTERRRTIPGGMAAELGKETGQAFRKYIYVHKAGFKSILSSLIIYMRLRIQQHQKHPVDMLPCGLISQQRTTPWC